MAAFEIHPFTAEWLRMEGEKSAKTALTFLVRANLRRFVRQTERPYADDRNQWFFVEVEAHLDIPCIGIA